MGNMQSSWLSRQRRRSTDTTDRSIIPTATSGSNSPSGVSGSDSAPGPTVGLEGGAEATTRRTRPYELRQTLYRLRRRMSDHATHLLHPTNPASSTTPNPTTTPLSLPPTSTEQVTSNTARSSAESSASAPFFLQNPNLSNSSLLSTTSSSSRRRRRELGEAEPTIAMESDARRPRLEALRDEVFSPDPEGTRGSYFFYFSFPQADPIQSGNNHRSSTITTSSSSSIPADLPADPTSAPRRRSSRLRRAAEYIRQHVGHSNNADVPASAHPEDALAGGEASTTAPGASSRQTVLVRIRQLPIQNAPNDPERPNGEEGEGSPRGGENAVNLPIQGQPGGEPNTEQEAEGERGDVQIQSVFQWTIYFVIPRDDVPTSLETASTRQYFDTDAAIQRAFAILRAMMAGENMSYEEWSRLQEMLGFVNRGVSKEQIESQLPWVAFSEPNSNIGISCPICLSDYMVDERLRTLPCQHTYHIECIDNWLLNCNNCPLCRRQPIYV